MAKIIKTNKKFLIIEMSRMEAIATFHFIDESDAEGYTGCRCDWCNKQPETGFYIAVLNSWYCKPCYEEFYNRAVWYNSDKKIEEANFERIKEKLNL